MHCELQGNNRKKLLVLRELLAVVRLHKVCFEPVRLDVRESIRGEVTRHVDCQRVQPIQFRSLHSLAGLVLLLHPEPLMNRDLE